MLIEKIIEQFKMVNEQYRQLQEVGEQVFRCVQERKKENFGQLGSLNIRQEEITKQLQKQLEMLHDRIAMFCQEKGIEEYKISSIVSYATPEEKEVLLRCQEQSFRYQKQIKHTATLCNGMIEAIMTTSKDIVDAWVHVSQEGNGAHSLIDKKL